MSSGLAEDSVDTASPSYLLGTFGRSVLEQFIVLGPVDP